MPITESLTVQILGDSSALQNELEHVAEMLGGLQQSLTDSSSNAGQLGNAFQSLSGATRPLQGITNQLSAINQQIQAIAQQPVMLNVAPAVEALMQLIQMAQMAAQQIAALNTSIPLGGMGGGMPMGGGMDGMPIRGYASGGLVTGPSGIDQVPARLSAGEFVMNRDAVAAIGVQRLEHINSTAGRSGASDSETVQSNLHTSVATPSFPVPRAMTVAYGATSNAASPSVRNSSTSTTSTQMLNNNFGGIQIHVRETADVQELFREMRVDGIGLRHRRG
ncbi:hypothetical protein [Planctomicrobium sp. SH527]|uniref:hypothetical protein n=1 Tax=Planctomicrobium sp. SH527 TaxID=3448123 RepID=UPI003F5C2C84